VEKVFENFRKKENFPVASLLIPAKARASILALYKFARFADEISDNAKLSNEDRKTKLKKIYTALQSGKISEMPYPVRDYYRACENGQMGLKHGLALLEAFIQDTEKKQYASWDETLFYCQRSAATIGRSVLEATAEFGGDIESSDKICAVLQLINHLQDIKEDYLHDNRVYFDASLIPDHLEIGQEKESDSITKGKLEIISRLREILNSSSGLVKQLGSFRIRAEIATIYKIAEALLDKLSQNDILSETRVELTSKEKKKALLKGFLWALKTIRLSKYSAAKIAFRSKSSFVKPLLKLNRQRRKAMLCFYSFCRLVDDVADDHLDRDVAKENLKFWFDEVERIYSKDVTVLPKHPVSWELSLAVRKYDIDKNHLLEIVKGQEMDISGQMVKPDKELFDLYCYRVAACVGLVSIQIFGYNPDNSEAVKTFAMDLGRALQLVNIMRDVEEDARKARIYIPEYLLEKYGLGHLTPAEIFHNYDKYEVDLEPALNKLYEEAMSLFEDAQQNLPAEETDNMKAALLMAKVYKKYLEKMKAKHFIFDREEISLTFKEKFNIFYEPARKV
jgi:phytoene/squalene synthetase